MRRHCRLLFAAISVPAALAAGPGAVPAHGQESGSMQVGNATVTVGSGAALIYLPDMFFLSTTTGVGNNTLRKLKTNDVDGDVGYNFNGELTFPTGEVGGSPVTIAVRGFYANVEANDSLSCTGTVAVVCSIDSIVATGAGSVNTGVGATLNANTERDVGNWAAAVEGRLAMGAGQQQYVAFGADVRGIDQDTTLNAAINIQKTTYTENLDTRYYGAYAAWGGKFFESLWSNLGLQSTFRLQGGVYAVDTDYDGRFVAMGPFPEVTTLSLSENDMAFVGGVTLEMRKQFGPHTALSLTGEAEYYSWVPEMRYNDANTFGGVTFGTPINRGTSIADDSGLALQLSLRLTIGLGPEQLYEQPASK